MERCSTSREHQLGLRRGSFFSFPTRHSNHGLTDGLQPPHQLVDRLPRALLIYSSSITPLRLQMHAAGNILLLVNTTFSWSRIIRLQRNEKYHLGCTGTMTRTKSFQNFRVFQLMVQLTGNILSSEKIFFWPLQITKTTTIIQRVSIEVRRFTSTT